MKIAVVGSRTVFPSDEELSKHLAFADEIVSGGAKGVDSCAAKYARGHGIKLAEFLPEYERYHRSAPLVRNRQIVDYADQVIVFWNGVSRGSLFVINYAKQVKKPCKIVLMEDEKMK